MRRPVISVIGDAALKPGCAKEQFAFSLGNALVSNGYRVLSGGLGGVMEAVSRGAHASPAYREGDVIAVLPGNDPAQANQYTDIVIATGLDHARNFIVANTDAVVAVGGGSGTLSELSYAWVMHRLIMAYRVPDVVKRKGVFSDWGALIADNKIDDKPRYPDIPDDCVFGVDTSDDVIRILAERLPKYTSRPLLAGKRN
ncbi:MAG: LOG family protein [Methanocorpusculum sp.]|uniref:SLOG cluster 4 domain-containing protein n=1 Tax=Methanocorpusculum sp. TaxID=2058474 RepID=UPI00271A8503|nr:LOG family protein [Methanocorpusculum sp.]MDO9523544.1 LOG family protein [Methanocorpusculum sp.]